MASSQPTPLRAADAKNANCVFIDREDDSKDIRTFAKMQLPKFDLDFRIFASERTTLRIRVERPEGQVKSFQSSSNSRWSVLGCPRGRVVQVLEEMLDNLNNSSSHGCNQVLLVHDVLPHLSNASIQVVCSQAEPAYPLQPCITDSLAYGTAIALFLCLSRPESLALPM